MTNKLTRIFALLMVSLALLTAPVIGGNYDTPFTVTAQAAKKKAPAISAKKKTVYYKSTATLKMKNYKGKVKWSTSNKKIAKVNSKGVVTGVAPGKCTVTATVGKKKYKCTVTVKDRNVTAATSFKVNGGGYFVKGESTATVTVKPKKYNAYKATVYIENAAGDTVYKKTLSKLTKNKKYTFTWNGKNTKGKYVSTGSYRVKVKIGTKVSYSSYLTFYGVNDFADGNGSSKNPFIVQNITHLKKLVKYPTAYFKQANDIDFNYTSIPSLFSADQPFSGTYDGNWKTIKNISGTASLFNTVGTKGTIKNVKMRNCSVVGDKTAILAKSNYGKIQNCNIEGIVSASSNGSANIGLAIYDNYGTVYNSSFGGTVTGSAVYNSAALACSAGGIVCVNEANGKIVSCTSYTDVTAKQKNFYPRAGGIAAVYNGLINGCESSGDVSGTCNGSKWNNESQGTIAGENSGQVISCSYTGLSAINLVGYNTGTIA
ncbi:MAG: Ig-like domain-containing protein [Clostridia bacterium]|nr:Ig-like domain-containing protein [Clostridia bacterium]